MPLQKALPVRAAPAVPRPSPRGPIAVRASLQPSQPGQPGDKLLPLLRSPFDLLALGPRVALGALTSLPQVFGEL